MLTDSSSPSPSMLAGTRSCHSSPREDGRLVEPVLSSAHAPARAHPGQIAQQKPCPDPLPPPEVRAGPGSVPAPWAGTASAGHIEGDRAPTGLSVSPGEGPESQCGVCCLCSHRFGCMLGSDPPAWPPSSDLSSHRVTVRRPARCSAPAPLAP